MFNRTATMGLRVNAAVALTLLIFLFDTITPLGYADWAFYLLPLLAARRSRHLLYFPAIMTLFLALGYFLSPPGGDPVRAAINRALETVVLWLVAFLLLAMERKQKELEKSYFELEERVRTRTGELTKANTVLQTEIAERSRIEGELKRSLSLHEATIEATADGILVVDTEGRIVSFNNIFLQLWKIPDSIIAARDDDQALELVLDQLKDPEAFLARVREVYAHPDSESFDTLWFKDARVFERYSKPQKVGGATVGRVWSFRDVTERKRAEGALRESEERFRQMADTAPVMIWMSDIDSLCTFFNKPWIDFTGRRLEDQVGWGWANGVHPDDRERCKDIYLAAFQARNKFEVEYRLRRANGEYRWVFDTGIPRFTQQGKFIGYIGSCFDITERKNAEEAVKQSEWRLDFASSVANEAIWDWEVVTNRIARNKIYARNFGLPGDGEDQVEWWKNRIHPADRDRVLDAFHDMFIGKREELSVEYRFLLKNGNWAEVHDRARVILDRHGAVSRIVGAMQDITARKDAENRIKESETNLRTILDSVYDAVFIHDMIGGVIEVNKKMLELYQVDREQALRCMVREDFSSQDNPTVNLPDMWKRVLLGENLVFEWKARRPNDGSVFDAEVFLTRINFRAQDAILAHVRDVTARKQNDRQLRKAKELSDALNTINTVIHSTLEFDTIMRKVIVEAAKAMEIDASSIGIFRDGQFVIQYVYHLPESAVGMQVEAEQMKGVRYAMSVRDVVTFNDAYHDERISIELARRYGIRSAMVAPLISKGIVTGALSFYCLSPFSFQDIHQETVRLAFAGARKCPSLRRT